MTVFAGLKKVVRCETASTFKIYIIYIYMYILFILDILLPAAYLTLLIHSANGSDIYSECLLH